MNLLLLSDQDFRPTEARLGAQTSRIGQTVCLTGRRAEHLRNVLKVTPGDTVRVGLLGYGAGAGEVLSVSESGEVSLRVLTLSPSAEPNTHLVLAVPRPKVLSRVLSAAASFGVGHICLINAWRVEKSYFSSPRLAVDRLEEDLRIGLEQGQLVHLPKVTVTARFTTYFEEIHPALFPSSLSIALHPGAPSNLSGALLLAKVASAKPHDGSVVFALGPEGGFIERELGSLREAGFHFAELGTGPLRTEVALAAALGQLALLRSLAATGLPTDPPPR